MSASLLRSHTSVTERSLFKVAFRLAGVAGGMASTKSAATETDRFWLKRSWPVPVTVTWYGPLLSTGVRAVLYGTLAVPHGGFPFAHTSLSEGNPGLVAGPVQSRWTWTWSTEPPGLLVEKLPLAVTGGVPMRMAPWSAGGVTETEPDMGGCWAPVAGLLPSRSATAPAATVARRQRAIRRPGGL